MHGNTREFKVLLLILAVIGLGFLSIGDVPYFGDEGYHEEQIRMFLNGNFSVAPSLTTFPGYHAFHALIAVITGHATLLSFRIVNVLLSMFAVMAFYFASKTVNPRTSVFRTAQFAYIPILFPFFFLLYTDVFSLLLILVSVVLLMRREYAVMAISAMAAVAVRQTNVIWLLFFFLGFLFKEGRALLRLLPPSLQWKGIHVQFPPSRGGISTAMLIATLGIFALDFLLFGAFLLWNGGIAIGDSGSHPFPSFHLGNVYFLLFLAFFIFLPLHVTNMRAMWRRIMKSPWVIPTMLVLFVAFMMTFVNDHGYNQGADSVFIRNRVLVFFTSTPELKALFFIPVALTLLSLRETRLYSSFMYMLYPMTVLFLIPSWLIEQRYFLIPFALFLVFRRERSERFEFVSALYNVICTILLFIPVALRWFFL